MLTDLMCISDCAEKVRSYGEGEYFGEIALVTDDNKRTATIIVTSKTALMLRLARSDIDPDLLDEICAVATLNIGNLKFAGDMEAQLEESREECASTYANDCNSVHLNAEHTGYCAIVQAQCCVNALPCY